jgi:hypothetical protein
MTPEAAIYGFLSSFGIPAYAASSVPDQPEREFPYITYQLVVGNWGSGTMTVPVNVWYRTDSEAEPNAKVREISKAIGMGGRTIPCDDGMLWLRRGRPWAQSLQISGEDSKVKRRYLNVDVEFLVTE